MLPGKSSDCGVTAIDNRLFVEAVLWIARTGAPWRDLPPHYGHWHRVYVRYNRWSHKGIWEHIFKTVANCYIPVEQRRLFRRAATGRASEIMTKFSTKIAIWLNDYSKNSKITEELPHDMNAWSETTK